VSWNSAHQVFFVAWIGRPLSHSAVKALRQAPSIRCFVVLCFTSLQTFHTDQISPWSVRADTGANCASRNGAAYAHVTYWTQEESCTDCKVLPIYEFNNLGGSLPSMRPQWNVRNQLRSTPSTTDARPSTAGRTLPMSVPIADRPSHPIMHGL
jgi:hypothetical protein